MRSIGSSSRDTPALPLHALPQTRPRIPLSKGSLLSPPARCRNGRAASVRRRAIGARSAPASVTRQPRHADCPHRCTRSADGHLTPGTARRPLSKPAATLSLPLASTTRERHSQTDNEHTPPPPASRSGRSRPRQAQRPPTASHDVLGLDNGAGRSGSNPTSAIVLSRRAARRRQRDDPIALLID